MHVSRGQVILAGRNVSGGASRILFPFPRVKLRAYEFEVGDRREPERVELGRVLRAPFRGGEPSASDLRRDSIGKLKCGDHPFLFPNHLSNAKGYIEQGFPAAETRRTGKDPEVPLKTEHGN